MKVAAIPILVLPVVATADPEAVMEKGDRMFGCEYRFHEWNESDHVIDGPDWSLPPDFVRASDRLRLAFLPNPNSPSGTVIPPDTMGAVGSTQYRA